MSEEKISPLRKWGTLIVLSLALAIIIIDTTLLNVSLEVIIRDLKTDIQSIQWVITAYSLTIAALTITGGRFGDLFGRKRMFVLGALLFAAGSFIASVSHSVPTMIVGEAIVEGIGAALMMPATASLLVSNFHGRERALAFGVWGGIAGASAAFGPIVGGYFSTNYSWRWGFRINVIVCLVLIASSFIIREARDTAEKKMIDWLGVVLSSLGLLSFVFGVIESSTYGWWKAKETFHIAGQALNLPGGLSITPFALAIGVIILTLFLLWEKKVAERGATPLVRLENFKNRQFSSSIFTTTVMGLGQTGLFFTIPVFLQSVQGLNPLQTGVALLPLSLTVLIVSPLVAVISSKIRPKYLILTGLALNTASFFVLRSEMTATATAADLRPGLILFGMGLGLIMSQISNMTMSALSVQEAGEASGINNTMRQVGSSLGSAIIGAILLSALSTNLANGVNASTVIPQSLKPMLSEAVSKQTSNVEFGGGAKLNGEIPAPVAEEIKKIGHQATADANRASLLWGATFAFLGFLSALLLPNIKGAEHGPKKETVSAGH